jgi:hypothetical protein
LCMHDTRRQGTNRSVVAGDRSRWMIIDKSQLPTGTGSYQKTITKSSLSATPCTWWNSVLAVHTCVAGSLFDSWSHSHW